MHIAVQNLQTAGQFLIICSDFRLQVAVQFFQADFRLQIDNASDDLCFYFLPVCRISFCLRNDFIPYAFQVFRYSGILRLYYQIFLKKRKIIDHLVQQFLVISYHGGNGVLYRMKISCQPAVRILLFQYIFQRSVKLRVKVQVLLGNIRLHRIASVYCKSVSGCPG